MKRTIFIGVMFFLLSSLAAQNKLFVDCIHGADYRVNWENYEPEEIDFQAYFPDYEVHKFTTDSLFLEEIYYDETQTGMQIIEYQVDLPEEPAPGGTRALYIIVENENDDYLRKATGIITNPDGDIVAEMFNGILHFDAAWGAGWVITVNLQFNDNYFIKIGYGPIMFGCPYFASQCHLEEYDVVLRINDQSYFAFLGAAPDYSIGDLSGLESEFQNGVGFLNINNMFDGMLDKPFVHFKANENIPITFQVTFPGQTTIASPKPESVRNSLTWNSLTLERNQFNEVIYEAKLDSKLNFLDFEINGADLKLENRVEYTIDNLKLIRYLKPGVYEFAEIQTIAPNSKHTIINWEEISTSNLKDKLKKEFYNDALEKGLDETEAQHFVYDFFWIESLLRRAYDNPEHYFGFYHFGDDLYNKLIPYVCQPAPEKVYRNMWVMLSDIQPRDREEVIAFPEQIVSEENLQKRYFVLNEYGVIDEYYSRYRSSREQEFFGIELDDFIYYWMMGAADFYDNEVANTISQNVTMNWLSHGHNTYLLTEDVIGLMYQTETNQPISVYRDFMENGRIIALGSDELLDGDIDKKQLITNMLDYLCQNGGSGFYSSQVPDNSYEIFNYPNPFNPTTTFSFSIEQNQQYERIELIIYNLKGQKVKDLSPSLCHAELYPLGRIVEVRGENICSVTWNGTDANGKAVSSGIYIYKLKFGDTEISKKMLLMK